MIEGARHALKLLSRPTFSCRGPAFCCFGLVLAVLVLSGAFAKVDRLVDDLFFALWSRPAESSLVLVEIDSRSLQRLNNWPWSRAYHASLIKELSQAGAAAIAFDIDFSAQSSPSGDAALSTAIGRSQSPVVLASFAQPDTHPRAVSAYRVNLPLSIFANSAETGLVNIVAGEDGEPREYRLVEDRMSGSPRTMAAVLAGAGSALPNAFLIDYSIDPASIPRLSYVDVLTGRYDPAMIAGKKVMIGATAFELGDRVAVPKHRILAGVEVQALAYSSIVGNRMIHPLGVGWVLLGLAVLVIGGTGLGTLRHPHLLAGVAGLSALGLGFVLQTGFAIALPIAAWLAAIAGWSLLTLICAARRHAQAALMHRALALRQKALMEGVFNDSSEGILIADDAGRILAANGAAGRLLEADPSVLNGLSVEIIRGGLALAPQAGAEITLATASGRELGLTASVSRSQSVGGDDSNVWIVTFRDESAKRAMEAARDATLHELQATTAAKNEFLARISHELRTPLSSIIGFSTMIGEQSLGPIGNGKYVEYARDIHSGGKRLLELVNDIIDITRIEAEQYEVRPDALEVQSLLGGCCIAARDADMCGEKSLRFEVAPGAAAMHSDRQALAKIIAKLLSNALKFTGPQGNIVLRASPGPDRAIVLEVADDGIGIAPQALKNVSTAFSQVRGGLDRRHEGSGLGLYLANRLTLLLGGRLEIDSTPGQGTTVRVVVPGALIETSQAA
jgi:signal transduction histidine kinase